MKKEIEQKISISIMICFIAFEVALRVIFKAIFNPLFENISTGIVIFSIIANIGILVLSLKLATLIVCKNNNKNYDKFKVIKSIIFFNLIITLIYAFIITINYKSDFQYYEEEKAKIENTSYEKMSKQKKEALESLVKASESMNNFFYDLTKQKILIDSVYICSRLFVILLLKIFLKEKNKKEYQDDIEKTESTLTSYKTLSVKEDLEKEKRYDYDFLFESQKKLNKAKGSDIAVGILGALSIIFSFISAILAVLFAAIGLIVAKSSITNQSDFIGKLGYTFCKIGICLAPAFIIITFVLNLFGVITSLSVLTMGIFSFCI